MVAGIGTPTRRARTVGRLRPPLSPDPAVTR
jgi:hypothetical protein